MKIYQESSEIRKSVEAYLKDRSPYQKERLHSALNKSGVAIRLERDRLINEFQSHSKFKVELGEEDKPHCFNCDLKVNPTDSNKCQFCDGDL